MAAELAVASAPVRICEASSGSACSMPLNASQRRVPHGPLSEPPGCENPRSTGHADLDADFVHHGDRIGAPQDGNPAIACPLPIDARIQCRQLAWRSGRKGKAGAAGEDRQAGNAQNGTYGRRVYIKCQCRQRYHPCNSATTTPFWQRTRPLVTSRRPAGCRVPHRRKAGAVVMASALRRTARRICSADRTSMDEA